MASVKVQKSDLQAYLDLKDSIRFLNENYVLVGIPDDTTDREDKGVTNAELLFIHTNGSPVNNIPPRPVIEPALYDSKDVIEKMLDQASKKAISGDKAGTILILKKIGMKAQNICRGWFTNLNNNWPPNSPGTRAAKIRKFRRYNKTGTYDPRPLIDTGELRKSITYVLSLRGRRSK